MSRNRIPELLTECFNLGLEVRFSLFLNEPMVSWSKEDENFYGHHHIVFFDKNQDNSKDIELSLVKALNDWEKHINAKS